MKLLLAPHDDDVELFAAFTAIRERPLICVCLDSHVQWRRELPITAAMRERETVQGLRELLGYGASDVRVERAGIPDSLGFEDAQCRGLQDLAEMESELRAKVFNRYDPEHVWAPAVETGGNAHHNLIGRLAAETWHGKVTHYLTYTATGKSTNGLTVKIEDGEWIGRKLRAMSCHVSQLKHAKAGCRPHFLRALDEYYQR